jgi:RNA polymerase-interacting CarD/CdnL/TRCF family regulator
METNHSYSKGNWIVHTQYGMGEIKGIDVKDISGEETRYFRIKSNNSTFWIPTDQMDSEVLRPLSTQEEIQLAITALQKPPKEMSSNYKERQSRIQKARILNTPQSMARIVRDLRERRRNKGPLNTTERSAYQTLKKRLIEEWAMVTDNKIEKITSRLDDLLNPKTSVA